MDPLWFHFAQLVADNLPKVKADPDRLQIILNTVFAIMAVVGVLIITVAGFKFINSKGDPQATGKARDAIVYTAIGLIVISMAYAIVTLALNVIGGEA